MADILISADTLREWRKLLADDENIEDNAAQVHDEISKELDNANEPHFTED